MLKALYNYAMSHELSLPDGYAKKNVAAYISFSANAPDYIGIHMGTKEEIACPDIGSLANSREKSNIIVEKRSVVIPNTDNPKSAFFRNTLVQFAHVDADAAVCAERLTNEFVLKRINELLDENKIKPENRISFMVDGRKLHNSPNLLSWWQGFRQEILPQKNGDMMPCLITGKLISPTITVPPVKGLQVVGGHASGDALICFDKAAFCSYGLKQGANAPVSESAMNAAKVALDSLLVDAPILCGMKFVHWYDRDIDRRDDPFFSINLFGSDQDDEGDDEDVDDEEYTAAEVESEAQKNANLVIESIQSGDTPPSLDAIYHILLLSGVGGRVMVRCYEQGQYEQLRQNIDKWNQDLALTHPYGLDCNCKPMKLIGRLFRLLNYQKEDDNILKRSKSNRDRRRGRRNYQKNDDNLLGKELSGITPTILTAILGGGMLPDAVAVRALAYIRSKMLTPDEKHTHNNLDSRACQWLKVWLLRNHERSEEHLKETYNPNHPEPAYHCGAAMAVYGEIQNKAMPDVNANIAQRYYASCIQSPALVLGSLSRMSVHHLSKIDQKFYQNLYRELLEQVYGAIGPVIPTTLNLEKQSYFALGYYQMYAKMRKDRIEAANKKNTQEE